LELQANQNVTEVKMNQTYTAIIQQRGDWWIGWIEEIPGINCQEKTREELLDTLRITLLEALDMSRFRNSKSIT